MLLQCGAVATKTVYNTFYNLYTVYKTLLLL